MVPQNPPRSPVGDQIRNQALCVEFLEASKAAHEDAERRRALILHDDERQIARTLRMVNGHGFSFRTAAVVLGIDRTRLRRILRDHPDESARREAVSA